MSIQIVGNVMRCGAIFRGGEKALLLVLANYADEEGYSRPSVPEMAWTSGLSDRQVRRLLLDIEDLRMVEIVEKGGGRRANRYRLNEAWLEWAAAEIGRVKAKLLQDGGDRYAAMAKRAGEIREALEHEMHADPDRGPRWRKRHPLKREAPESVETASEKILIGAECQGSPDISDATPDTTSGLPCQSLSPESSIEPKPDPSVDTAPAARDAPKPQRCRGRNGPRLGEEARGEGIEPPPHAPEREDVSVVAQFEAQRARASPALLATKASRLARGAA